MFLPKPGLLVGNRYSLTQAIGRGGMGEVWKAHDHELDTPCAVKFILQHLATDRGIRERFSREAKAVARLRSPHVVQILGVGEVEDTPYLAMELLSGETLLARLDRLGKLDPIVTMKVVEQVGEALESAHQAGIVHRDLKPENIWFWSGSKVFVKVLDFGVAKTGLKTGSLQTATGALVGTPQYMSPEQALGNRDVDHRSDLWSLAVITVECLCGKRPFESEGLGDLLLKIVSNTPPSLQELAPELPVGLHDWWSRALARDPRQRFQSAGELVEALRPHLVGNAPYSELAYSGFPHSGFPQAGGFPHSGFPQSGAVHSGAGAVHSGAGAVHSGAGAVHSGRPYSARSHEDAPYARGAVVTDAAGMVGAAPASRPVFPTEVQPRSAERQASGQPLSAAAPSAAAQSGTVQSGAMHSGQPHSAGFQPSSSQPHSRQADAPQPSTGSGVVSERSQQQPAGGSVGPISSSRRAPARDSRKRNVVIAAVLVSVGVLGTAWRMLDSDEPRATSSLPPPAASDPAAPATEKPAAPSSVPPDSAALPPVKPAAVVANLPANNPWDNVLGTGKPGEPRTAVEALQPRTPAPPAPTVPPQAAPSAEQPAAVPPQATPPQATPPRATPPRAPAPARAAAPAPAAPRKASSLSAADVGLSAPPTNKVNPAQSTANPGPGGAAAAPGQGDGQAESEAERKAKLKRKIGLGSK